MVRFEDVNHYRLLARYYLDVKKDPQKAISFARINWQYQREPDDALILLRSAQLAQDQGQLRVVINWLDSTGLQDKRIEQLLNKPGGLMSCLDCT